MSQCTVFYLINAPHVFFTHIDRGLLSGIGCRLNLLLAFYDLSAQKKLAKSRLGRAIIAMET